MAGRDARPVDERPGGVEAGHGTEANREVFQRETLPHLEGITLSAMAEATWLSEQHCSLIRRGRTRGTRQHVQSSSAGYSVKLQLASISGTLGTGVGGGGKYRPTQAKPDDAGRAGGGADAGGKPGYARHRS